MLIILDGWGIREKQSNNAVVQGNTPNYDRWMRQLERAIVHTSGEHVGLVPDQMGNSEVGHMNLGAGRIVYQDIARIDMAINDGSLAEHEILLDAFKQVKNSAANIHFIGLLGPGGVHSHQGHLHALLDIAQDNGVNPVIHVITDGRDTPTESGIGFYENLKKKMEKVGVGRVATVSGRYYAMDRDKRWERTKKAFDAMTQREGKRAATAEEAIRNSYAEGVTDEFIVPVVIGDDEGLAIKPGDVVLCYNFRADRMRQLAKAFTVSGIGDFTADDFVPDLRLITVTKYEDDLDAEVLFARQDITNTLAKVLSDNGKRQYHSAETEKYAHVTFFFNGRQEEPWPGEDRKIIPSPQVATYDLQPEMSAYELTEATLQRIQSHDDDFILINFANPDMVGHTGDLAAAIKAVEAVDACAGRLVEAVSDKGGVAIVTADHGNAERMLDESTGEPHTYHTVGPVSLFIIDPTTYYELWTWGRLADVAPTVLDLVGLEAPEEMTGRSLIKARKERVKATAGAGD
jgi:2,3-bisphosphoglycerate-independent phosphoglycerate mutase